jgi:acyl carrier protein
MSRPNIQTIYGLSPQQKGILFETQASGGGGYVEQTSVSLPGPLNPEAFRRAWQRIVDRHDVLRTAFVWKDQVEPVQVVLAQLELPLTEHDLRSLSGPEQVQQIARLVADERGRPFDLGKPPLLRVMLLRTGEMTYQLIWTQHHILMDGWCVPIVFDEFRELYGAACVGQEAALPAAPQYRDYIAWLKRQDPQTAKRFWQDALDGFRSPTPIGIEDPAYQPPPEPERFGAVADTLGGQDTAALEAMARESRLTPNTLLQGAWALLLGRFSGRDEVLFGVTASGRPADLPGVERMVGMFNNTAPCLARLDPDAPLVAWLAELQARQAATRRFEHCSTGEIHEWTEVPRSERLYESIMVVENYPDRRRPDETAAGTFVGARTVYTLTLVAQPGADLRVTCVYDSHRVDGATAARLLRHWLDLVRTLVAQPQARVGELLASVPAGAVPRLRAPERAIVLAGGADDEPMSDVEERLSELCQELLALPSVPMTRSFFALGGHSLLVNRLAAVIRRDFDVELPLRTYFEARNLRELATALEEAIIASVETLTEEEAERLAGASVG